MKKDCASNICTVSHSTHGITGIVAETSLLMVSNSYAEYAHDRDVQKVCKNVNGIAKSSDDSVASDLRAEDYDGASHTNSRLLSAGNEQTEEISETQSEISMEKNTCRMPDMSSALAKDMMNLYHNKVLPKINSCVLVSSNCCPYSVLPTSAANSGLGSCKMPRTVIGVRVPISSTRQLKRTVAAKTTSVSKSPFKLVKTFQPSVCCETGSPSVSKSLQATAHFDIGAHNITGERTCHSMLTSCRIDTVPCSTSESDKCVVSCSSSLPKKFPVQITQAVSNNSKAISCQNSCATVSDFVRGKNTTLNDKGYVSSKYKLIRRELPCKNTARQSSANNTTVSPYVTRRVVKNTPTSLVNKHKLVRKKQSSLIMSAKRTPLDIKKTAPLINLGSDILPPFCSSSTSTLKMRSSRYKLMRDSPRPHSTPVKKLHKQSASNQAGRFCGNSASKSNMRSGRYKLVRTNNQPYSASVKKLIRQPVSNQAGLFCENSSMTSSKTRLSRYKLVRASDHLHSTSVKTLGRESALNQADAKVQVLSKYKLIRKKCAQTSRTAYLATSTPANSSASKYTMPPLFLNKYKLIRKRALLRTNSGSVKNSTLQSPRLKHISKPAVEGFKHHYSRKQHAAAGTSLLYRLPPRKRGTRKKNFLSKYALQRSSRGRQSIFLLA